MATSTALPDRSSARDWSIALERSLKAVYAPVQFAGFWTGTLLPLVLFPMLLSGVASEHLVPFVALVAANVVALLAGRDYDPD